MGSDKKAEVFFKNLDMSVSFQNRLREIRKSFGLPSSGYKSLKKARDWLWKLDDEGYGDMFKKNNRYREMKSYEAAKNALMGEFRIPPSFASLLDDKILSPNAGEAIWSWESVAHGCTLVDPTEEDRLYNFKLRKYWDASLPTAKLLIHAGAKKTDVLDYVRNNWDRIQELIKTRKPIKGIRSRPNKSRDEIIFEYWNMSREQLGVKKGRYKIFKVQELLKEEQGIDETDYNIKRICIEQQRLKK